MRLSFNGAGLPASQLTRGVHTWLVRGAVLYMAAQLTVMAGIAPTALEVNLGAVAFSQYTASSTLYAQNGCNTALYPTYRACLQARLLQYTPAPGAIAGARFQIGLGSDTFSRAFNTDGTINLAWYAGFNAFLTDLVNAGFTSADPSFTLIAANPDYGFITTPSPAILSQCSGLSAGQPLHFVSWLPFGFLPNNSPDCQFVNTGYLSGASPNPTFWGWSKFFNLAATTFGAIHNKGLDIHRVDIQQELDLFNFPVEARIIYDNTTKTDVLTTIQNHMNAEFASSGYAGRVTYSVVADNPSDTATNVNVYDCLSVYGDSALLIKQSELDNALSGGFFGSPSNPNYSLVPSLACGGSTLGMVNLPVSYTLPNVIAVHVTPGVRNATNTDFDVSSVAQNASVATTVYSDLWNYISGHNRTAAQVVIGSTTPPSMGNPSLCVGFPASFSAATWNVNGYVASSLYTNHAANSVMALGEYPGDPGALGFVNTNGTAVTWVSGTKFNAAMTNSTIVISGTSYTVGSVTDPADIILTTPATILNGVGYTNSPGCYAIPRTLGPYFP